MTDKAKQLGEQPAFALARKSVNHHGNKVYDFDPGMTLRTYIVVEMAKGLASSGWLERNQKSNSIDIKSYSLADTAISLTEAILERLAKETP